jgi:hypothetical protein
MIALIILMVVTWFPIARYFYGLGIKKEQQARLRRLSSLRKLLNGKV